MNLLTPASTRALPVAAYIGGKKNASKHIIPIIDGTAHTTYAEPFVGMGGIFLRRKCAPKAEVINDYNREVSNLFRILQRHYPQFIETLRFQITSRAEFARLIKAPPETLTDLERAARFLYLQRLAFGGKVSDNHFGVAVERPARFDLSKLTPMLADLHERLLGVVIECLDWSEFIGRYDREKTLFYLDPPYWGNENDYGKGMFERGDFTKMSRQLKGIKGRFLLSINDRKEIRKLYDWAYIRHLKVTYSISSKKKMEAGELLIANFKLD